VTQSRMYDTYQQTVITPAINNNITLGERMHHKRYNQSTTSKSTSTNVIWIKNCRHALSRLAGSRQTLQHKQQRAEGGRHCRHHESMTYQKSSNINRCIFTWTILPNFIL